MKFIKFWFPVILYSVIIFCVSSLPDLGSKVPIEYPDKVAHILVYMLFGGLVARALRFGGQRVFNLTFCLGATLASFAYGLSDEIHQSMVPGRNFEMLDLLADTLGGFLGAAIYWWFRGDRQERLN